jgi:hypothetical protein
MISIAIDALVELVLLLLNTQNSSRTRRQFFGGKCETHFSPTNKSTRSKRRQIMR